MHKLSTYVYTTFCFTVSWLRSRASNYCVYETDVAAWSLVLLSHHQRPGKRHQHPAATQPHPWDPGSCTCGACFVYGNFTLVRLLLASAPFVLRSPIDRVEGKDPTDRLFVVVPL